ncbi:hypothetical protein AX16_007080 [Volvariella volvacea WC 439]|nr:hypothetical protein AX16_007080 [Volvariella volvacea WC 439]
MTVLITGGTGKTGSRLSKLLHNAGYTVLVASRSGDPPSPAIHGVKFDWLDTSTHSNPFTEAEKLSLSAIDRIYLVATMTEMDTLKYMKPFIEFGIEKGVKRFVLLSASTIAMGYPAMGKVHEYFVQREPQVDYVVLRPSWFFENFGVQWLGSIRDQDEIPSRGGDGKVPFVSADDIAETAFKALTEEPSPNTDWNIAGPDLLTFGEVAALVSEVLGRKIVHTGQTDEECVAFHTALGLTRGFAEFLSFAQGLISQGAEVEAAKSERTNIGKRHLKDWLEENKALWASKGDL